MELNLDQDHPDRIRSQDLTFLDRQRRLAKDDISVDGKDPDKELSSDWTMSTGVKMTNDYQRHYVRQLQP